MLELITKRGSKTELQLGFRFGRLKHWFCLISCFARLILFSIWSVPGINFCYATRKPAVIIIVGVNGGGKTTSLGKMGNYCGCKFPPELSMLVVKFHFF